ncbi:MAG: thiolase family protein [Leptospirales bacterium]|jgi:acetyl-CoA acyltransferase
MSKQSNTIPQTMLLGAVDVIGGESEHISNKKIGRDERAELFLGEAVAKLCRFFQTDLERLRPLLTDFISCGPPIYSKAKYHDTMHKADFLGITGTHCHVSDQGGASITSALIQAQAIVQQNPYALILIAAADIPRTGFSGKADYAQLNQGVMHPEFESDYGGNLIAFYALLAKRQLRDEGVTEDNLREITKHFRAAVQTNPRAYNFEKELSEKQIHKYFAEPYPVPMIALMTDHAVATLVCGEAILPEVKKILTLPDAPLYVGHGVTSHHAAYFTLKGGLESPSRVNGPLVLERNALKPEDIDYAWIYDCFVGMIIEQAANYFGISQKRAATDLADGCLRVNGKTIPVNRGGGILNYQAALMLSSGTGLMDVLSNYGLAADPLFAAPKTRPGVALLGGNGGLDTVNSLVPIATRPFPPPVNRPANQGRARLHFNNPAKTAGQKGRIRLSTTVHFNTGGNRKPPYVLAFTELPDGNLTLSNVYRDGAALKNDADLAAGTPVRFEEIEGLVQAVVVDS